MTKPWGIERLDQVAQVVGRGIAPKYDDDGDFLVVNQRCIRDGRVSLDIARRHNSGARKVKADKVLSAGDVLVNSTGVGTLGRTAPLRDVQSSITADSHVTILRPLPDVSSRWFAYAVSALEPEIENLAEGSTGQTELSRHRLADLELTVPPLSEQHAIAATLGALDDKIESNRRAISFLFKIATATLSDGEDHVRLGDIATVTKGLSYKGAGLDDGTGAGALPMLNLASFTTTGELKSAGTKWYTGAFKPQHVLSPWEVVIANTDLTQARELLGRGFLVPPQYQGALHTHHTSVVRFFERSDLSLLLWAQLQSTEFRDRAKGFATGTTVAALPPEAVLDFEITVPADHDALLARARLMIEKAWQLERESERLKVTRDALLPALLSGSIRVPVEGAET